jgi:GMP synthase (glutamine-hydrolysing)
MVVLSAEKPVLLLQLGEAIDSVRAIHGTYHSWYERAFGGGLALHDGRLGGKGPDPRDFAGVIVTGSARSLVRPEPWMDDAADVVDRARDHGTPVLGVCFGHQLIGRTFGGAVVENPSGWEIGSHDVEVSDRADPLFEDLPATIRVNETHQDMVIVQQPAAESGGLRAIATNAHTPVQAVAVDDHVRGVQFHPELSGVVTRGYIEARRALMGGQDVDAILARTADAPHGLAVMRNFRRNYIDRG